MYMSELFTVFGIGVLKLTPRHSHTPYLCDHGHRSSDSGAGVMILWGTKPSKQRENAGKY